MVFKKIQFTLCIVTVLLGVWTEVTRGEARIQLTPQHPVIGGSVTLTVTEITGSIKYITWYAPTRGRILTYITGLFPTQDNGPLFHNRVEVPSSGSLRISNLNRTDEGQYRVKIQTDRQEDISVYLTVYDQVGKPTITSSSSQPKEYDRVTLTCTSANSERITWSRVSGSISSGVTFSSDNKTLTWPRITRTDSGAYQCKGENPLSSNVSDPYTLTVSYGPEDIQIIKQKLGNGTILLECLAESVPPSDYQWTLSGTNVTHRQETLHVEPSKPENTGLYMCVATNSVTQKTAHASINVPGTSVSPQPEVDNKTAMIIGTVIAVMLLIVVGVLVYIFLIRKCKKQSNSTTEAKKPSSSVHANATEN